MINWLVDLIWKKFGNIILNKILDHSRNKIKEIIVYAIESSFRNEKVLTNNHLDYGFDEGRWQLITIKSAIDKAVEENMYNELQFRIKSLTKENNDYINSEEFINKIIERINKKQLKV